MKEAVKWCSDALARRAIVAHMTHYRVSKGRLWSTDGNVMASHPVGCDLEFLVPGKLFEKALAATSGEPKLTLKDGMLIVKSGGFRARIPTLDEHDFDLPEMAPKQARTPLPQGMLHKVSLLQPFMSTDASRIIFTCLAARKGYLFATNNRVLVRVPITMPKGLSVLIPAWAAAFLSEHPDGCEAWALTEENIQFFWKGGGWMRSQLVAGEFPATVDDLLADAAKQKMSQDIYEDWLESLEKVAGLTEGNLHLREGLIVGTEGATTVEDRAENTLPEGVEETVWRAEDLILMARVAEEWNPRAWPNPAAFIGPEGLLGVIVGSAV